MSYRLVHPCIMCNIFLQIEEQIENMFASIKRVTNVSHPVLNNPQQSVTVSAAQSNQQKLELAKRLAAQISKKKGPDAQDITQIAARSLMTGEGTAPLVAVS